MPKSKQSPSVLRDSWKKNVAPKLGRRFLKFLKRMVLTLAVIGLLGAFFYLLFTPIWHANTHLVLISGGQTESREVAPLNYISNDLEEFRELTPSLATDTSALSQEIIELETEQSIDELKKRLELLPVRSRDVLIVYVSAHGFVVDGRAFLACQNFDPTQKGLGKISVTQFLKVIAANPAATKLILLESGQHPLDARLGFIANQFPKMLRNELEVLGEDSIWVLGSNDSLQRSLVSGRDMRTSFGYYVAEGLSGNADLNQDGILRINELYQYVQGQVSAFSDYESTGQLQSPFLSSSESNLRSANPVLLSVEPLVKKSKASALTSTDSPAEEASTADTETPTPVQDEKLPLESTIAENDAPTDADPDQSSETDQLEKPPAGIVKATNERRLVVEHALSGEMRKKLEQIWEENYGNLAALQREAWDLYFQFEDSDASGRRPVDYAPFAWRELGELIMFYDQQVRLGNSPGQMEERLREIVKALQALRVGDAIPEAARNDVIDRIVASRPETYLDPSLVFSMGIGQQAESSGFVLLGPTFQRQRNAFDMTLEEPSEIGLIKWLEENPDLQRMYEPWLAKRLLSIPNLGWDLQKQAISLSRLAETVGSPTVTHVPWILKSLETADKVRWRSIALMEDQTVPRWSLRASAGLEESRKMYRLAEDQINAVKEALRLRNDLVLRLPYYARVPFLERTVRPGPFYRDLDNLVNAVKGLDSMIRNLASINLTTLRSGIENSILAHEKFSFTLLPTTEASDKLQSAANRGTIDLESLLNIPVLDPTTRSLILQLRQNGATLEGDSLTTVGLTETDAQSPMFDRGLLRGARRHFAMEVKIAELAEFSFNQPTTNLEKLRTTFETWFGQRTVDSIGDDDFEFWSQACSEMNVGLADFYQELPRQIVSALSRDVSSTDHENRVQYLTGLYNTWRASSLIDPRDLDSQETLVTQTALTEELCYDWLRLQRHRLLTAAQNQTLPIRKYLLDIRRQCRAAMNQLRPQKNIPPDASEMLELVGVNTVSLGGGRTGEIEITCKYLGLKPEKIWLFVDYNSQALVVEEVGVKSVYDLNDLRESQEVSLSVLELAGIGLDPTLNGNRAGKLVETYVASPGETRQFRFLVSPQPNSTDTKLIVSAAAGGQVIKHETIAKIAAQSDWELVLEPRQSEVSYDHGNSVSLHPLPNRAADYELFIRNLSNRERQVSLQLLAPQESIQSQIPLGDISALALQQKLDGLGIIQVLHQTPPWNVAADQQLKPIPMVAIEEDKEKADEPEKDSEPIKIPVRHGILAVLTDNDSKESRIWQLEFLPQKPQKFVDVIAGYDAERGRIEIKASTPQGRRIPLDGHKVVCEFENPISPQATVRLRDRITPGSTEVELFAEVPPSVGRTETVFVHVDDYPRAFIFNIPCWKTVRRISPSANEMRFKITKPQAQRSYQAPADAIAVEFQVDAPIGAFDDPNDRVQIGIDADRDRELSRERSIEFYSDRQAAIWFLGLDPDGKILTDNLVGDFQVNVPGTGYRNARVNLLGRVVANSRYQWSNSVEVLLDSKAPNIQRVLLEPGSVVTPEDELKVRIVVDDDEMSGVASISLGMADEQGELNEEFPVVEAEKQQDNSWLGVIPLADLALGTNELLITASDVVGNQGEFFKKQFNLVSAEKMAENQAAETFKIRGAVVYYNDSVSGAKVELTGVDGAVAVAISDDRGVFQFEGVPAGDYSLSAVSVIRNKPRLFKSQLIAGPEEKGNQSLIIKLE